MTMRDELERLVAKWRDPKLWDGGISAKRADELSAILAAHPQIESNAYAGLGGLVHELEQWHKLGARRDCKACYEVPRILEEAKAWLSDKPQTELALKCGMIVDPPECATECGKPAAYVSSRDRTHGCCAGCFLGMALHGKRSAIRGPFRDGGRAR